jgi:lipopolysaccharide export system permease protein
VKPRLRLLDGYVSRLWLQIFVVSTIGLPLFTILILLTDNIGKHIASDIPMQRIALAYVYKSVEQVFQVIPAAVLFATVFTVGALSRHSELTAAKASGTSFHRLVAPILVLAALAAGLTYAVGEAVPLANQRYSELVGERQIRSQSARYNFVYRADGGRVYAIRQLVTAQGTMQDVQIEREGTGADNPGWFLTAARAQWSDRAGWILSDGALRVFFGPDHEVTMTFDSAWQRAMTERPADLLSEPKAPDEMSFRELGHYVRTLERSGSDANKLKVNRALKIVIPFTCLVIAIFGAPLGITNTRGGAAYGVAVSLATAIVFLVLVQVSRAVGTSGALPPLVAAWLPNVGFGLAGLVLFARART